MFLLLLSLQEDYDHVSLEDKHYQGDGMLSPKAKLLLRDTKKELLRYATLLRHLQASLSGQL